TPTEIPPAARRLRARWAVCPFAENDHTNASAPRSGWESEWSRESWRSRNACDGYCALSCSGTPAFRQPGAAVQRGMRALKKSAPEYGCETTGGIRAEKT